ncbi:integrase catalytic domain-containing protein [Caerostris darwini]|uniref:Integrase catalytic domain-containing protein n=1 Tax=Caerostris darwini TaxID=1538125 RepID=A0AAV4NFZ7_9ARAC|nr:integrase catalytic domain-containing protein [Caerostris darwini]
MGGLPKACVEISRPFTIYSCVFTGSIEIKLSKGRGEEFTKACVSLFVCLATKVLHLELVGDLNSEYFISAVKRFTSRRGCPSHIYSDNATNFIGV